MRIVNDIAVGALATVIKGYQVFVSPVLPRSCRFYPTCSEYILEAFQVHGFAKGVALGSWRLARCHPFHPGGYDPVPTVKDDTIGNKERDE
jgi:putative membrane protein insertion efficiency factor